MNIAINSYTGAGFWFAIRLLREKHNVDILLTKERYANVLCGLIPEPKVITRDAYPPYDNYDVSVFDVTGRKHHSLHSSNICPTLGDGYFNCNLEDDRDFGIQVMEECGILVPPYERFDHPHDAKRFIRLSGKQYVYKPDTEGGVEQDTSTTYVSKDSEDMVNHIDKLFEESHKASFILQEVIKGCEVSTEGWFNGEEFYLVNSTLELKKFMNDDKGPSTGCSGSLVFVHGLTEPKVYLEGLAKTKDYLKSQKYVGPIDLNTIATPEGLYGLEWTPRFGYDATALLTNMYAGDFGEMLCAIATGNRPEQSYRAEYCASVRCTVPPYPVNEHDIDLEGRVIEGIDEEDYEHTYMFDVYKNGKGLVTAGHNGYVAAPMGIGSSIGEAFWEVDKRLKKLRLIDVQYRTDVEKSLCKRYHELQNEGWLK